MKTKYSSSKHQENTSSEFWKVQIIIFQKYDENFAQCFRGATDFHPESLVLSSEFIR